MEIIDLSRPIYFSNESTSIINSKSNYDIHNAKKNQFVITLMQLDEISRNNNRYPAIDFIKAIKESSRIEELITNNCLFGEAEHPYIESGEMTAQRMFRIDPDNILWRIVKIWIENGTTIKGILQWAEPKGKIYRTNVEEHDMNIAASVRSYTPNVVKRVIGGRTILDKVFPLFPVTWDGVLLPGFENTRRLDEKQFSLSHKDQFGIESLNQIYADKMLTECYIKNPAKELMGMINDIHSTESAQIIGDLYGFDITKAKIKVLSDESIQIVSKADNINLITHANTAGICNLTL